MFEFLIALHAAVSVSGKIVKASDRTKLDTATSVAPGAQRDAKGGAAVAHAADRLQQYDDRAEIVLDLRAAGEVCERKESLC